MKKQQIHSINHGRRSSLKYLSGMSLLALGACCRTTRPPAEIATLLRMTSSEAVFLRPPTITSLHKTPSFSIDVHTHFFNAADVNVKGYVAGPIARTMPSETLRKLVRLLAGVVNALASLAPTAKQEYDQLMGMAADTAFTKRDVMGQRSMLLDMISQQRQLIAQQLHQEMIKQGADSVYLQALEEYDTKRGVVVKTRREFSEELVLQAITPSRRKRDYSLMSVNEIEAVKLDPSGLLQFIGQMLTSRWSSLMDYQEAYTTNAGSFGIDAAFASLVDFDYWLDCIPPSARHDQVVLHSLLSTLSGGYMLPIVAYNPWTDIKHADASLQLVKEAIEQYGFVGVKLYPANGFYAYGNAELANTTAQRRPEDLRALDKKLLALFTYCAEQRVPVMAHTSESMGSDAQANLFGGPAGWNQLLDQFKAATQPPIINAGHFGGDEPGTDDAGHSTNNQWPAEFGTIMNSNTGRYFYGDLAYWSDLERCRQDDCVPKQRLRDALRTSQQRAAERIMYGSDWLMSSKEADWQSFPSNLQHQLSGVLPLERFFYHNAMQCFGLAKGGSQRQKIIARFEHQPGGLPAWLRG